MKKLWIALAGAAALPAWGAEPRAAFDKAGCNACHTVDKKLVGPSLKDIAAKYKGADAAKIDELAKKVKAGGVGVWGQIPMPANATIPEDDIRRIVGWILDGAP